MDSSSERVTELPKDDSGVSDDGEGGSGRGAQMSRGERGGKKEDGTGYFWVGVQADAILAMRWLRLPQHLPAATVWRVKEWSKRLGPGGAKRLAVLRQSCASLIVGGLPPAS
jgi:hypothetical protein